MEKKEKIVPVQYIPIHCEEEEIDLKEIIKTILKYKKFIIGFTFLSVILSLIYLLTKTPIYEIKSNIMIGQINGQPVVSNKEVAQYTKALYKKEIEKNFKTMPKAYLKDIKIPKNTNTFLTLIIDGINNKYNIEKKNEILKKIQNAFNYKIEKYITEEKNKLQNLNTQLLSIKIIEKENIKNKIKTLQKKIEINAKLIEFYKNKLINIEKDIKNLNEKIKKIYKLITSSNKNLDLLTYQNILTNLYNNLKELESKKEDIITNKIPTLISKNQQLLNQIENLKQTLKITLPQEEKNILNNIKLINISLKNTFFTKEIGEPLIYDHPIKPKKKLILVVAFVTGLILSIFLVFLIEFIKSLKESE